jgi:hypothetical protein
MMGVPPWGQRALERAALPRRGVFTVALFPVLCKRMRSGSLTLGRESVTFGSAAGLFRGSGWMLRAVSSNWQLFFGRLSFAVILSQPSPSTVCHGGNASARGGLWQRFGGLTTQTRTVYPPVEPCIPQRGVSLPEATLWSIPGRFGQPAEASGR